MLRLRGIESRGVGVPVGVWVALLTTALSAPAMALIEVDLGNRPAFDEHWPAGSLQLGNLPTRVGWWEGPPYGGGERCFMYRGNAADMQQAVDAFGKIRVPVLQLIIHDNGPAESPFLKDEKDPKADIHYDWSFTVWNPQSWNQLYNNPADQFWAEEPDEFRETVAPPKFELYESHERGIDFSKLKVPASVSVVDQRADTNGFPGGSAVVGDVYDMTTSKPVVGATIVLAREKGEDKWDEAASGKTDADGHFELRSKEKGYLAVIASAQGYASRVLRRPELRGNTFIRFSSYLSPVATMKGAAVDTDGKPTAGVTVRVASVTGLDGRGYLLPVQLEITTDAKGAFEFTGLPRGYAQLFASGTHYAGLDILKLHTIPEDDLTIRLTATGAIKGRVIDKVGKPANRGTVDIEPDVPERDRIGRWAGGCDTAADGSFHFEDVPPGRYIVTALAKNPGPAMLGKDPNAKTITVKAGEAITVEITGR
jgi:hypothetical protein